MIKLIFSSLLISFFSFSSHANWVSCYNSESNRVYFNKKDPGPQTKCKGPIYYQAANGYEMITETFDQNGAPTGEAGPSKNINLDNGRKLFISQWNDWSKSNTVMVLEPNFKKKNVIKLCQFRNHGDAFSHKYDKEKKVLKVLVKQPKPGDSEQLVTKWIDCPL